MIFNRILRKIYSRLRKGSRFPYKWKNPEYETIFRINNSIEEFRLKAWGGEKEYVIGMMNELRIDDIFFDIGSSVGLNSILAAKRLKYGQVISFEPDPENTVRLKENYSLNKLTNFKILPIAIGSAKDKMRLYTQGSNGFSPSLRKVNGIESFIEVQVDSIDDLISRGEVPVPTVVKIDIEGAEFEALKGMKNLLDQANRPRLLFIEIHPDFIPSFGTSVEEIMLYLNAFKYRITENVQRDKQVLVKLCAE